jgi:hypothetical protein
MIGHVLTNINKHPDVKSQHYIEMDNLGRAKTSTNHRRQKNLFFEMKI